MKKLLFLTLAAAVGFGCSEESEFCDATPPAGDNGEIQISAVIADVNPLLKTTISESTATFASGDAIGLFCPQAKTTEAKNVQFTYGTPWTTSTPIYWADGTTYHKFVAYAPYASGNTDSTAIKLPALNTQTGTLTSAQDFLISNNLKHGVQRATGAGLTFTHAFSLIEFQVKTDVGIATSSTLTNFTLAGGNSNDKMFTNDATNSTINLTTGAITPGGSATTNTITVTPGTPPILSGSATKLYVLLLPGTFTAPTLQIKFKDGGSGSDITIPNATLSTTAFAAATKYIYVVTISRTAIEISNPTITEWGTGTGGNINAGV